MRSNIVTKAQVQALTEPPKGKVVSAKYNPYREFSSYMLGFYGKGGLYDIGMTADEVLEGTVMYIQAGRPFEGDSLDRESIRDIILANRGE